MIKVIKKEWNDFEKVYELSLEDGDKVFIPEKQYNTIQTHTSLEGKRLKAIVNEHEDEFEEPVEYLGFEIA